MQKIHLKRGDINYFIFLLLLLLLLLLLSLSAIIIYHYNTQIRANFVNNYCKSLCVKYFLITSNRVTAQSQFYISYSIGIFFFFSNCEIFVEFVALNSIKSNRTFTELILFKRFITIL